MIKNMLLGKKAVAFLLAWAVFIFPIVLVAQTDIKRPKNKYRIEEDVRLGREAASKAERTFPILNDAEAVGYLEKMGLRLVANIPREFTQTAFRYSFKIIDARDLNAFALPGGPMYVNRGMIESATNEGELAGVIAHEIAHVALRHGTAQATKMNNPWNRVLGIGAVLGGAIIGGDTGAEVGAALYSGFIVLPYSRENETQADILGSRILADAGYDPRDLANIFKTIERESGSGGPSWFSTHPSPAKRYETISREASMLNVDRNPIKMTQGLLRAKESLSRYPKAKTLAEIEKERGVGNIPSPYDNNQGSGSSDYRTRVEPPAASTRRVSNGNWVELSVPGNWREFSSGQSIEFAPDGAHGGQGITHGMMIGVYRAQVYDLYAGTQEYLENVLRSNSYLRLTSGVDRQSVINGQQGYLALLEGTSPITRRTELITVYTTSLRNGDLFYAITVVPANERRNYSNTFRIALSSIRLYY